MLFNSAIFLFFFAAVFALYCVLRSSPLRKALLLVASYLFYAHWDWRFTSLLALSTLVDFVAGARIHASTDRLRRRLWLLASLFTNLGILAVFKYGNFLLAQLEPLLGAGAFENVALPDEIPVGISFYTFQTLSYTIDLYRGRTTPCRNLGDFALYVAFFAQLVAGPIVRSTEFLPQIEKVRSPRAEAVAAGMQRFVLGLFKKVVLADNVGLFVDAVFADPGGYSALTLWMAMYGFALQIYCDFSGYTDMALGIGRAFHLKFPENFDAPYLSRSITEFWRRWHMSLSRWLRDYLYIPLGGSRDGSLMTYRNLMLTMLLGGLWHGAAWSFVIWGGYMGALLALERLFWFGRDEGASARWSPADWLRMLVTFHLVCFGWVVFRGVGLDTIGTYFGRMFTAWSWTGEGERAGLWWAAALAALCTGQYLCRSRQLARTVWEPSPAILQGLALALLLLAISAFHVHEISFIYFQF